MYNSLGTRKPKMKSPDRVIVTMLSFASRIGSPMHVGVALVVLSLPAVAATLCVNPPAREAVILPSNPLSVLPQRGT